MFSGAEVVRAGVLGGPWEVFGGPPADLVPIVLVSMPDQGPALMIQILRSMKLMQASRILSPSPSCLLQSCCSGVILPIHSTLALPRLAQLFCNGEVPTSGCCRDIMAWCPTIATGSRRGWFQGGQSAYA